MGMGLIGAGAAVKGLMSGYQQGRKFAREEEAAEDEKTLRGLKIQGAQQSLKKGEMELEESGMRMDDIKYNRTLEDEARGITEKYLGQLNTPAAPAQAAPAAGLAGPGQTMTTPDGTEVQMPVPGTPTAQPAAAAPQRSRFDIMREMNAELLNNQMRRRGADRGAILKQSIDSARFFSKAETQTTIDAMNRFYAGTPQDQILSELRSQGVPVQPGTNFAIVDRKDPQTGVEFKDVQIQLPGGRTVSQFDLARASLDPKDLLSYNNDLGRIYEQVRHNKQVETQTQQNAAAAAARDVAQHEERMAELRATRQAHLESMRSRNKELDILKATQQQEKFQNQVSMLYGYKPMDAKTRLQLEREGQESLDRAEAMESQKAWRVYMSMAIASMNIDEKTGAISITPAEAKSAFDNTTDPKQLKSDSDGRKYVLVGGRKVYVPAPPGQEAGSAPPPSPQPKPGLPGPKAAAPGPRKSSDVTDQQLMAAVRQSGMAGYTVQILGPRPGIRNQSGVNAWDAEAEALSARLNTLLAGQRAPGSR